jgi:hypothetical protein
MNSPFSTVLLLLLPPVAGSLVLETNIAPPYQVAGSG